MESKFLDEVGQYFTKHCSEIEMVQSSLQPKSNLWDSILVTCDSIKVFEAKNYFETVNDPKGYLKVVISDPDVYNELPTAEPQGGWKFENINEFTFQALVQRVDTKIFKDVTPEKTLKKASSSDRPLSASQYRHFSKK